MAQSHQDPRAIYEIQVEGELDKGWAEWFNGLVVTPGFTEDQPPCTTLVGPVADQSALRGMLCRLWDLNLTLVSVRRIEEEEKDGRSDTII